MEISPWKSSVGLFKEHLTLVLRGGREGRASGEPPAGAELERSGFILLAEMAIPP